MSIEKLRSDWNLMTEEEKLEFRTQKRKTLKKYKLLRVRLKVRLLKMKNILGKVAFLCFTLSMQFYHTQNEI